MKTLATILAGAALAFAGSSTTLAKSAEENEAKLARMLEGRTAGEPVSCISALNSNRIEVIEHVGIVYDAGNTIYVARPSDPRQLGRNDVVVIDRHSSQLCTTDVIRTIDRYQGFTTGAVFLDKFVPYTKQQG
jgi:hypothetical protein